MKFLRHFILLMLVMATIIGYGSSKEAPAKMSLNFQDINVRALLQIVAEFSNENVVVSDKVNGKVAIHLDDVSWQQALDVILRSHGLSYRKMKNVLLIAPEQVLMTQEKQNLEAQKQVAALEPLQTTMIHLKYANAQQIATLLKDSNNNLLSERSAVSVDKRTNTILIQDAPKNLIAIKSLIDKLDIPVKQVMIEARIVNVDTDYEHQLGFRFGVTQEANNISGTLDGANQLAGGKSASQVDVNNRLNVNLPAGLVNGFNPGSFGMALAKLGSGFLLDMELSALENKGVAKLVSNPRLMAADQQTAHIQIGEEIPYPETTSSGAAAIAFKKAVLGLAVTPQITPDKKIILALKVTQDKRGQIVTSTGEPSIDTREVETHVLVANGETVVLGGIYDEHHQNVVTKIPVLGSIPVLGRLFQHKTTQDNKTEMLIFITPKIMKAAGKQKA